MGVDALLLALDVLSALGLHLLKLMQKHFKPVLFVFDLLLLFLVVVVVIVDVLLLL
jgi:hypothetical protein